MVVIFIAFESIFLEKKIRKSSDNLLWLSISM